MKLFLLLSLYTVTLHTSKTYRNHQGIDEIGMSACTGVFVSPDSIVTAGHCLTNNRNHQWVKTNDGKSYAADIVMIDPDDDIALIRVKGLKHKYSAIGKQVVPSERIYTVNSGEDNAGTYGEGVVENVIEIPELKHPGILHNIAIFHGASGSGIFNAKGQLVGINDMTSGALSWAINTTTIRNFLNVNGIETN